MLTGRGVTACLLRQVYSEMLQDAANDSDDAALVDFVWQRRGETWAKLEKFEDVVQRQFEELRMSLVAHAHQPLSLTGAAGATPGAGSSPDRASMHAAGATPLPPPPGSPKPSLPYQEPFQRPNATPTTLPSILCPYSHA